MSPFSEYLAKIDNPAHRDQLASVLDWVSTTYPQLVGQIKWNRPMFTDHGTFIISFTAASKHFTVGPEPQVFAAVLPKLEQLGLEHGKKTFQIPFDAPVPTDLLATIIEQTMTLKQDVSSFWL